jgi:pimeloyl-ACP methyl ester carboxylesterase
MKTQVNGVTIAYEDKGTGPAIVFLHAFPLNRTMWAPQAAVLSRTFRTISIDLRGLGESDAPYWRYSLEQYARDIKEVLTGLGIMNALFVGLSMGGYLEFALYRLYPDMMLGLVLADTRAEADKADRFSGVSTLRNGRRRRVRRRSLPRCCRSCSRLNAMSGIPAS